MLTCLGAPSSFHRQEPYWPPTKPASVQVACQASNARNLQPDALTQALLEAKGKGNKNWWVHELVRFFAEQRDTE
jgi:hypothetical protein